MLCSRQKKNIKKSEKDIARERFLHWDYDFSWNIMDFNVIETRDTLK